MKYVGSVLLITFLLSLTIPGVAATQKLIHIDDLPETTGRTCPHGWVVAPASHDPSVDLDGDGIICMKIIANKGHG